MHIADLVERFADDDLPVRIEAYDSSVTGPEDAPVTVRLRSPRALRYLAFSPGELGFARAYVSGEIDIDGDMFTAIALLGRMRRPVIRPREMASALGVLGPRLLGRAPVPPEEIRTHGRLHSKRRDAAAISHHYDVSNEFYRIVLGPTMAYTCAVFSDGTAGLEAAQSEKFDLVCRKLDLRPGMRLLDVGCGWGGMVLHATRHYGVSALGVTLSRQQAEWARAGIASAGLGDRTEVRHLDYRDVTPADGPFDAISSIGLTEHIGAEQLPAYFEHLCSLLEPEGRLLNHAIMRPTTQRSGLAPRGFMNRYVFPDAELLTVGEIAQVMADHGFEIRHEENLREHYALTLAHWGENLMDGWDSAVSLAGAGRARVWRLYMAASRWLFDTNRMQLHQLLGVKTTDGRSGFPWRPDWESRRLALEEPAHT